MDVGFAFSLRPLYPGSYNLAVAGMTLNHDAGPVSPIEEETVCRAQPVGHNILPSSTRADLS